MRLSPLDIRKQDFTRTFRGFDVEEVQAFLQMLSKQWEDLQDELRRSEERRRDLQAKIQHYEKVEEALQEALQTARESSRKAVANAERKAELLVEEAEMRADAIKKEAHEERQQLRREVNTLSTRRSEVAARLRAFLMSEMELLARFEGDDPIGFIKLLPVEEHRRARLAEGDMRPEAASAAEDEDEAGAGGGGRAQRSSAAPEGARPAGAAGGRGEEEEDEAAAEAMRSAPGWTVRSLVSAPIPDDEREGDPQDDVSDAWDDDQEDDASDQNVTASSEEIEKIRRILSDLD